MTTKVSEMTTDELQVFIETVIDRKLAEWLGDPEEGLELKAEIRERILRQRKEFAAGKRGRSLKEAALGFSPGLGKRSLRG